jgi:hypothetical protein
MISLAATRRVSPWLVGLFLMAQIFGVGFLLSGHTMHVAQAEMAFSQGESGTVTLPHGHHHQRNDADGCVQHHELETLINAVLLCAMSRAERVVAHVAAATYASPALVETAPVLLERPPKKILSV